MGTDACDISSTMNYSEIWETVQEATEKFGLCPNRVWAIARSHAQRERSLPHLLERRAGEPIQGHRGHDQCGFEFCEYSRRDFTAVAQRHELKSCTDYPCKRLRYHFPMALLEEATKARKLTAWKLDGMSMIEPPQPFMAVSHVWSDGTGMGAWQQGEVNSCLYNYFRALAEQFQCEGIWWDTICLPKGKAARSIAINRMQLNYEHAKVTLVHDCFLRTWEWFDAETACFAIIMSPWFSRGWTALELAKSRKVKVVFKDAIIKDLDEEILAKPGTGPIRHRHRIASEVIANLRHGTVTTVNGLVQILRSRSTSWPRDMAVISGLLAGIEIEPDAPQQKIYQDILKRMGYISHESLFHNSTTMSKGFSWCPTSLMDMQVSLTESTLRVCENGEVSGPWKIVHGLGQISKERYNWKDVHPLIKTRLLSALQDPEECRLLVEPTATDDLEINPQSMNRTGSVIRALLVKPVKEKFQFVGPIYFQPPLELHEQSESPIDVTIGGSPQAQAYHAEHLNHVGPDLPIQVGYGTSPDLKGGYDQAQLLWAAEGHEAINKLLPEKDHLNSIYGGAWTELHYAAWLCYEDVIKLLLQNSNHSVRDRRGQHAIHLAAERGNKKIARLLLDRGADPNVQCHRKQTALHRAAWAGSAEVVKELLSRGVDPTIRDSNGQTALHLAAKYAYLEVTNLLVKASSNIINLLDHQGFTPLHVAAKTGDWKTVQLLLGAGADLKVPNSNGLRPLHIAAEGGNDAIVRLLQRSDISISMPSDGWKLLCSASKGGLESVVGKLLSDNKAYIQLASSDEHLPLHSAAEGGCEGVARLLLEKGADARKKDKAGRTPLWIAAASGHKGFLELLLLKNGVDIIETKDKNGYTPLWAAAMNGQKIIVDLLLKRGYDPNIKEGEYSRTPLWIAATNGHEDVVQLLLERGADITMRDNNNCTPLWIAAVNGHEGVVDILLEKGAHIEVKDNHGLTPLLIAAINGHKGVAKLLIERGADSEVKDDNGRTPLWWAATNGHTSMTEILLEKGTLIDTAEKYDQGLLFRAAANGHKAVVELILENGADIEANYDYGETQLWMAAANGHEDVVELLLDKGAYIEAKDEYGRTPLWIASRYGHEGIIELLLRKGAYIEVKDKFGGTPLWIAAANGYKSVTRLLLEKGANTEAMDDNGRTSLWISSANGHREIVEVLLKKGADIMAKDEDGHTPLSAAKAYGFEGVIELLLRPGTSTRSLSAS